jgi:hypothetical protein
VRRFLIVRLLPLAFSIVPFLLAVVVVAATPRVAWDFYRSHISNMDWLILGLGLGLFLAQFALSWRALQWRGTHFDERPDRWISNLAQAAEWFPLLGLIGTVGGILQTFHEISTKGGATQPADIVKLYAPALTATGSGLFMALINILPTWMVLVGRELILAMGGGEPGRAEESRP